MTPEQQERINQVKERMAEIPNEIFAFLGDDIASAIRQEDWFELATKFRQLGLAANSWSEAATALTLLSMFDES